MKKIAYRYINFWNDKDLTQLSSLLSPNVVLNDWESNIIGLENVISANKILFENSPNIHASIIDITCVENLCFLQLEIFIAADFAFKVIDVLNFSGEKIIKIDAYRQ